METSVLVAKWDFAASSESVAGVKDALDESAEYIIRTKTPGEKAEKQIRIAVGTVAALVSTGLWGSGPFSITLTGNETDFFLSVKGR